MAIEIIGMVSGKLGFKLEGALSVKSAWVRNRAETYFPGNLPPGEGSYLFGGVEKTRFHQGRVSHSSSACNRSRSLA